ncbi:DUF819 family protein [Oceanivirga salmonicida]|uniref:DUF819 family protein n=1 Tax=Oceanivirga salmonicida TaxID=1769291 RepID=UPI0012E1733C|nr:DUF819 family protein [Oceanivirga salmonicida]
MISSDNIWGLWSILICIAAFSIYLEQKYEIAAKITGVIIALGFAMFLSNFGIIPLESPVYDSIWTYVVPMAIPLLLFKCNIYQIGKESGRLMVIFLISSVGTMIGSILGYFLLYKYIPELNHVAGMMSATYIGGSLNFVAVSTSFNVDSKLIAAATVSDNLLAVIYFFVLIIIPSIKFFNKHFERAYGNDSNKVEKFKENKEKIEMSLKDIAFAFASTVTIVTVSFALSNYLNSNFQGELIIFLGNKYLILTTLTVILATVFPKFFSNISGAQELGIFLIYIFFAVIGVPASIISIIQNSPLLLVYCLIIVVVNMLVTFIGAKIFNFKLEEAILASNANIGGPTTAVAMATSKNWTIYIAPVMLVGTFGYVIGNYFGLFIGRTLM